MSPICQTFVQNAWKRDLCSNCFKTKDEHGEKRRVLQSGYDSSSSDSSVNGRRKHPITSSIIGRSDSKLGEKTIGDGLTPQSRYVGVANSRIGYQRNYYGWKSRLGDASEASGLRSPGLIFKSDSNGSLNTICNNSINSVLRSPGLIKGMLPSSPTSKNVDNVSKPSLLKSSVALSSSTSSLSSNTSSPVSNQTNLSPPISSSVLSQSVNLQTRLSDNVSKENQKNSKLNKTMTEKESSESEVNNFLRNIEEMNKNELIRRVNLSTEFSKVAPSSSLSLNSEKKCISNPSRSQSADDVLKCNEDKLINNGQSPKAVSDATENVLPESNEEEFENLCPNNSTGASNHNDSGVLSVDISSELGDSNHSSCTTQLSPSIPSSENTSVADSTDSDGKCTGFYSINGIEDNNHCSDSEEDNHSTISLDLKTQSNKVDDTRNCVKSCLSRRKSSLHKNKVSRSIHFSNKEEIIGYGGDVDYSDDEDFFNDDDDDDLLDSFNVTVRDKLLKKLTLKNTDFNSENDNLDECAVLEDCHYGLLKEFEKANEEYDIHEDINDVFVPQPKPPEIETTIESNLNANDKTDLKIKLKRSTPLVSAKPLVSKSLSNGLPSPKINPVLPMKNGELIRTRSDGTPFIIETVPLQGIKPKYVLKEEEIIEKDSENYSTVHSREAKITSFGCDDVQNISDKITSFSVDDPIDKVTSFNSVKEDCQANNSMEESTPKQSSTKLQGENNEEENDKPKLVRPARQKKKKMDKNDAESNTLEDKDGSSTKILLNDSKISKSSVSQKKFLLPKPKDPVYLTSKSKILSSNSSKLSNVVLNQVSTNSDSSSQNKDYIKNTEKSESILPTPITTSPSGSCRRRSSFLATQLGFAKEDLEEEEPNVSESFGNQPATCETSFSQKTEKLAFTVQNSASETKIDQLNLESNCLPSDKNKNEKLLISKSENANDGEKWSDTASNSTENDDNKSSASSETYKTGRSENSSQRSSTSSLSTFGTPLSNGSSNQLKITPGNSPYDHSSTHNVKPCSSSKDFLQNIKAPVDNSAPTASIQKSSFYASTSCLKGLPASKPICAPKPPSLMNQTLIERSASNQLQEKETLLNNSSHVARNLSATFATMGPKTEVVYDLPVTVSETKTESSPLHYTSTSLLSNDSLLMHSSKQSESDEKDQNCSEPTAVKSDENESQNSTSRKDFEAKRSFLSNAFSSNMLGPHVIDEADTIDESDLKTISSQISNVNIDSNEGESTKTSATEFPKLSNILPQPVHNNNFPPQTSSNSVQNDRFTRFEVDSYSSFTDDFDDEDEDDEEIRKVNGIAQTESQVVIEKEEASLPKIVTQPTEMRRIGERSSSATPLYRNSVGQANYDATGELVFMKQLFL